MKYRHDQNTFRSMINSGTVDTHIDPYTHTNEYWSEPLVVVCYSCCFVIFYKYPRSDLSASPWINTCPLCQLPRYRFCSLFSFPCTGIPVIKSRYVWPDDDGWYRDTERAQRIYLHRRGSKSQSWAIKLLVILFHEPVSHRNSHPFADDV
jgi:hypothetical protein